MRKHHHSDVQQQTLLTGINALAAKIVDIEFDNPTHDEANIRRHIHLKSQLLMLTELLRDDYDDPAAIAAQEEAQRLANLNGDL